jgi:hypothetical protein
MKMYDYVCKACNSQFQHRKPNKIYCSQKCYFTSIAETWRVERVCAVCGQNYIPSHKKQEYCGHKCHGKINGEAKRNSVEVSCNRCGKNFQRRVSAVNAENYCSWECRKTPTEKTCEACNKKYTVNSTNWKTSRFCTKSCAKSGVNHHFYGKHPQMPEGYEPWLKGKTAATDERVAEMAKKVSETHKQQFAQGVRNNKGANNPNYGKTPDTRTQEQKEKYSKAAVKRMMELSSTKHKNYIRGWHVSAKAGKMLYKSSLEKRLMVCFDADSTITSYAYEPFAIKYQSGKRYIPDFLTTSTNGKQQLIESKGAQFLSGESTAQKTEAAMIFCKENGCDYHLLTAQEIKKYETSLGILFSLSDLKKELGKL